MSKLGETTDIILELLSEGERVNINKLEEKVPLTDIEILKFMSQVGLIELKNGEVNITDFGSKVKAVE